MKKKFFSINISIFLLLFLVLAILPFIYNAFYNHPASDDFVYANRFVNKSLFSVVKGQYLLWSGRYWATIVSYIHPFNYDMPNAIKLYPILLIILFVLTLFSYIYFLFYSYLPVKKILGITLIILVAILCNMPSIFEAFYWFSGYITYTFPYLYLFVLFALIAKFYRFEITSPRIYTIICAFLVFCVVGSNELIMIILDMILAYVCISQYYSKRKIDVFILVLSIVAILFTIIVIGAPGNIVRFNAHQEMNHINKFDVSCIQTFWFFYTYSQPLLLLSPLYIILVGKYSIVSNHVFFKLNPYVLIPFCILVIFILHAFYIFSTTVCPHDRMQNDIYIFFVLAWFYCLQVLIQHPMYMKVHKFFEFKFFKIIAIFLFLLVFFSFENNIVTAYVDVISHKSFSFNSTRNKQAEILQESKGKSIVVLPALPTVPKTLTHQTYPVSASKSQAVFRFSKRYFMVDTLVFENDTVGVSSNVETIKKMFR